MRSKASRSASSKRSRTVLRSCRSGCRRNIDPRVQKNGGVPKDAAANFCPLAPCPLLRRFLHWKRFANPGHLQIADGADRVEQLERDPGHVELVPRKTVARGDRVRVMVVVPALAEREECDPPAVARVVARFEAARAPHVRGG